jgi:hypothetical protein
LLGCKTSLYILDTRLIKIWSAFFFLVL